MRITNQAVFRSIFTLFLLSLYLISRKAIEHNACPVTEPVWAKLPEDSAVSNNARPVIISLGRKEW